MIRAARKPKNKRQIQKPLHIWRAPKKSINELAEELNRLHGQVKSTLHNALFIAKQAGDVLRKLKARVGHGNWLDWLAKNFDGVPATANNYMRISRHWDWLEARVAESNIGIFEALKQLRIPKQTKMRQPSKAETARAWLKTWVEETFDRLTDEQVIAAYEGGLRDELDRCVERFLAGLRPDSGAVASPPEQHDGSHGTTDNHERTRLRHLSDGDPKGCTVEGSVLPLAIAKNNKTKRLTGR